MPIEDLLIAVYCLIDELFKSVTQNVKLRTRGFAPKLADTEVITIEIVGEFLGLDSDMAIYRYFNEHWKNLFPALGSRTNFIKQAAALWRIKQLIQKSLAHQLGAFDDPHHIVDGLPIPVCHFARAHFSKVFKGDADFGYCASKKQTYYGFHGHILVSQNGIITRFTLTKASDSEREALWELAEKINGLVLGDKGYLGKDFREQLRIYQNIDLQTPLRSNMSDPRPKSIRSMYNNQRRRVETVIGQLTERFHINKVRARNMWHLTSRIARKILAHSVAVFLRDYGGTKSLDFDSLVSA